MRPITHSIPKPMIPVLGKPFLEHQLKMLSDAGFRRMLLLAGYLSQKIEEYFGDGSSFGYELSYSYEPSPMGTGGALKNAEALLDESFVLLTGDTYLAIDYGAFLDVFRKTGAEALLVAYEKNDAAGNLPANTVANNTQVAADGLLTAYRRGTGEGLTDGLTHVDAGAVAYRKSILSRIPAGQKCSLEDEIYPQLIRERAMRAWATTVPFYDMGTPAGLDALAAKLA